MREAEERWQHLRRLDASSLRKHQEEQAWNIARYHLEHNALYRDKVGSALPSRWHELPVMRKSDFQRPLEELISDEFYLKELYVANTSGSSGHPFFYAKDKFCHALTWAEIKALYAEHGLSSRSRQARFYGMPLKGKSHWIERAKDFAMNRRRFPVFDLSDEVLDKWISLFKRRRFDYLYGYTSSLVYFARHCRLRGISLKDICPSLRLCLVTSEVCTPEDRNILEQGFGLPVVNEYGASETGLIAFEHPDGRWQLCEELLYVEVVDEHDHPLPFGKTGRLLITSLYNRAMPFIRYEIGDVGILQKGANGRRELASLQGRTNDFVRLPSGGVSPGFTFYYISRSLLEEKSFIKEFIIRQTAIHRLEFYVVADRPLTEAEKRLIGQKADEYLEPGLEIVVHEVDRIERSEAGGGKIKHFYSEL